MPQISVQINKSNKEREFNIKRLSRLAKQICTSFTNRQKENIAYQIGITMVNDLQIRRLNKKFLNKNTTTDCLSFDLSDSKEQRVFELLINTEKAAKQAQHRGHSTEAEIALYITHSLLHNLGFDDSTQTKAKKMHLAEDEILQQYGYGYVYNKKHRRKK